MPVVWKRVSCQSSQFAPPYYLIAHDWGGGWDGVGGQSRVTHDGHCEQSPWFGTLCRSVLRGGVLVSCVVPPVIMDIVSRVLGFEHCAAQFSEVVS